MHRPSHKLGSYPLVARRIMQEGTKCQPPQQLNQYGHQQQHRRHFQYKKWCLKYRAERRQTLLSNPPTGHDSGAEFCHLFRSIPLWLQRQPRCQQCQIGQQTRTQTPQKSCRSQRQQRNRVA
ncbi:Uncharacterised protein [Vibrio cholerae]|nr:Uncharacterised protein [Vibrio cholerae]